MPADPTTLLAPLKTAYPKYAGVFDALGQIIQADAPPPILSPVAPPAAIAPPAAPAPDLVTTVGRLVHLDGNGVPFTADFGDAAGAFNVLSGYNAGHVFDLPGDYCITIRHDGQPDITQHVSVQPDARPQVTLAAGADLAKAIAQLRDETVLLLPAGATFDLTAAAIINANGVTIRPAGPGASPRIRRIAAADSPSALVSAGANISIEGIEFDSDHPLAASTEKVNVYAIKAQARNLVVRNCTFRNVDDGVHCLPQANGLLVLGCTFTNEMRSCGVYLDAMHNAVLLGNTAAGSQREHIVRAEGATNVLIHGNDFANPNGKETAALRIASCAALTANTFRDWVRVSQGPQAAPQIYCSKIMLSGNHFAGLRPGGTWLQINPGSQEVSINGNDFDVDSQQLCVAVQGPCTGVVLSQNRQLMQPGTASAKPLVHGFDGSAIDPTTGKPAPVHAEFTETLTIAVAAPLVPKAP